MRSYLAPARITSPLWFRRTNPWSQKPLLIAVSPKLSLRQPGMGGFREAMWVASKRTCLLRWGDSCEQSQWPYFLVNQGCGLEFERWTGFSHSNTPTWLIGNYQSGVCQENPWHGLSSQLECRSMWPRGTYPYHSLAKFGTQLGIPRWHKSQFPNMTTNMTTNSAARGKAWDPSSNGLSTKKNTSRCTPPK